MNKPEVEDFWPWRAELAWSDPGDGAYKEVLHSGAVPSDTAWACAAMVQLVKSSPQLISDMETDQLLWEPHPDRAGHVVIRGTGSAVRTLVVHARRYTAWTVIEDPLFDSRVPRTVSFTVTAEPLEQEDSLDKEDVDAFRSWLSGVISTYDGMLRVGLED